jgi:hypothetical protein
MRKSGMCYLFVMYLLYIFNYHVVREDLCQTEN